MARKSTSAPAPVPVPPSASGSLTDPSPARERTPRRGRLLAIGAALIVLALLVVVGRPLGQRWLDQRQPVPIGGRLVLPTDSGLSVYSLDDHRLTTLVAASGGDIISAAAWSPDHTRIAYGYFHRRPEDPASVSEIYLAGADGSQPHPLAERDRPGAILDSPAWSPDGQLIYYAYFGQVSGRPVQRIDRVTVATGERQSVVDNGYAPDVSQDGRSLLFLRDERAGTGVWLLPLAGGPERPILPPGRYPTPAVPRFSPDGSRVAMSIMNTNTARAPQSGLLAWLLPPPAYAHGQPWDIWTFDLQGNDPRRLTNVSADDPSPVWSPDGRYVAFWGGTGLYLVSASGGDVRQLLDKGGYGAIDWMP